MNTFRAFLAIELDQQLRDHLGLIQQDLTADCPAIKWVNTHQLHLTLKFFGHFPFEQFGSVQNILQEICGEFNPTLFKFNKLGYFPENKKPRVIWAGSSLAQPNSCLAELAEAIEKSLVLLNAPKAEQTFTPHVTLGRIKTPENNSILVKKIKSYRFDKEIEQMFNRVTLFKSTLTSQGPVHESLAVFDLGKSRTLG